MKTASSTRIAQVLTVLALAAVASTVQAASTWTYAGTSGSGSCASGSGNSLGCGTLSGVTMTASGFSTKTSSGTTFATAPLYNWNGGLGVVNSNEDSGSTGPHATDNQSGTDAILLQFTSEVNLTGIKFGWTGTSDFSSDSDFSILAYTPSVASGTVASTLVAGKTLTGDPATSTLLTSGWHLVGNYADLATNENQTIDSNVYSSYWLISAYKGTYGSSSSNGGNLNTGSGNRDYFKLSSITASNETPEPGSLALMGIAMAGFVATRRRKQKAA